VEGYAMALYKRTRARESEREGGRGSKTVKLALSNE